jgi:hypothetical protein
VVLDIFDVRGRRIRSLNPEPLPAGRNVLTWDRLDAAGARPVCGLYFVRLRTTEGASVRKLLLRHP